MDIYSTIKSAIANLSDNTSATREALYGRAREVVRSSPDIATALEKAIERIEREETRRSPHLLEPSNTLRILAFISVFGIIGQCVFPFIYVISASASSFALLPIINVGSFAGLIGFFWLRWRLRVQQEKINAQTATGFLLDEDYFLYLRPFSVTRKISVPCLLPRFLDRWIFGKYWDLELALSLCNSADRYLISVGQVKRSFGAAKLLTTDDKWQSLVGQLAARAGVILIVPSARSGTLWELRYTLGHEDTWRKTILVMPPTRWISLLLQPFRRSNARNWRLAQRAAEGCGIKLPDYRRSGALLIDDGTGLVSYGTVDFNPQYLRRFFTEVTKANSSQLSAADLKNKLNILSKGYSKRRSLFEHFLFLFVPSLRPLLFLLAVTWLSRIFLFQPFDVPSPSMEETLLTGERLFVSKFSYGYSRYSIPFAPPLFSGRIFYSMPERGDVVVFRHDDSDWIKRVIGLPGDRVQISNGVLYINWKPVKRERIDDFIGEDPCGSSRSLVRIRRSRETLPNGRAYNTLECPTRPEGFDPNNTDVYTVPRDQYFVMGDNRNNSEDSRFPDFGYVPSDTLIGKVKIIFYSDQDSYVRWGRLFTVVR